MAISWGVVEGYGRDIFTDCILKIPLQRELGSFRKRLQKLISTIRFGKPFWRTHIDLKPLGLGFKPEPFSGKRFSKIQMLPLSFLEQEYEDLECK